MTDIWKRDATWDGSTALGGQWRRLWPLLATLFVPVALLLAVVAAFALKGRIPVSALMADPLAVAGDLPVYTGIVSTIEGLLWCATAAVCLFTVAVARRKRSTSPLGLLAAAGAVSALLLADDVFLFHDDVFPHYLGVDEAQVFAAYGVLVTLVVVAFRKTILGTDYLLLAIALGAFAMSIGVDQYEAFDPILLEDGAKLVGIVTWAAYFMRLCARCLSVSEHHDAPLEQAVSGSVSRGG